MFNKELIKSINETLSKKYCYTKGDYMGKCVLCGNTMENVSKRSVLCRECAYHKYIMQLQENIKSLTSCSKCGKDGNFSEPIMLCDCCFNETTPKEKFVWRFEEALQNNITKIIIAIKMNQSDSVDLIINDTNLQYKLDYYKQAYDDNLVLKNCKDISIVNYMFC